jgi:bacillithiol system protein YtxJ
VRDPILQLRDTTELDQVFRSPCAVLYKHSKRCGICTAALLEVRHFADTHPATPVYMVDVLAQRRLSNAITDRLNVRHKSPQVIVVSGGAAVWHRAHFGVTADALKRAVSDAEAETPSA